MDYLAITFDVIKQDLKDDIVRQMCIGMNVCSFFAGERNIPALSWCVRHLVLSQTCPKGRVVP